jgi:hypothetical protein
MINFDKNQMNNNNQENRVDDQDYENILET